MNSPRRRRPRPQPRRIPIDTAGIYLVGGPYDGRVDPHPEMYIDAAGVVYLPRPCEDVSDQMKETPYLVKYVPTDRIGRYQHDGWVET